MRIDATRRVGGGAQNQHLGLGRNGSLELSGTHLEILLDTRLYNHAFALGQLHHLDIAYPVGSRQHHLVTGIDKRENRVANRLFGTVRYHNLVGRKVEAILIFQFCADGLAQIHITRHGRIVREVVVYRLLRRILDMLRGIEIGFSYTQVDYIDTLSLQFITFLRHRKRLRRCKSCQTVGYLVHENSCF